MQKSIWELATRNKDTSLTSAVLDTSIDGIAALKAIRTSGGVISDFEYFVVNAKASELLRRNRGYLIGKRLLKEFPGTEKNGLFQKYAGVVETGETFSDEIHYGFDDLDNWFRIIATRLGDGIVMTFADITQSKANERKIRQNKGLIEKVFNSTSDSLVILKPVRAEGIIKDFEYILLNAQAEKVLNKSTDAVRGKTVLELYPGTVSKGIFELYVQAYEHRKPFETEFNYEADGMDHWFCQKGIRLENELLIITTDISKIKRAEREITDRNKFILRIAESTPGLLYLFDLRTNKNLYVNRKIEEYLGYTPESIRHMGNDFLETMIHPYDLLAYDNHRKKIFKAKDKEVHVVDYRLRHIQGRWVWFRFYETIFERDADGLPTLVVGSGESIASRKESEDEMRKLKSLCDNSSDFVGIASLDGYVEYLNEAGRNLVGLPDFDIRRTHLLDYFLPRDREYVQSTVLPMVREKGKWIGEINFRNFRTSVSIPVTWNVFMVYDNNNQPIGVACVTRDVSTRKQREDALEQSESRFRTLFEKSNDGILLLERNQFVDINESASAMLGATDKREFLKRYLWDVSPTYQRDGRLSVEKAEDMINNVLQHGPQKLEWTFRKSSGELFSCEILLTSVSMGYQKIIQIVWRG